MNFESKKKYFFKGVLGAVIFGTVFVLVISIIKICSNPQSSVDNKNLQSALNNFEEETIFHGYLDNKDGFYIGELSGGKIKGNGQYILITGSSYNGNWNVNEKPEGEGILILKDVGRYEGEFYNGQREGEGTFKWLNGDAYTGDWLLDKISGFGTITYSNGDILEGFFSENKFVSGDFTTELDIGTIKISLDKHGTEEAVLTLKDGTKYTGMLIDGKFSGDCIIDYANGDRYDGKVEENIKSGYGTYKWDNGASYVGDWSNDKMNGSGTYYYNYSFYGKKLKGEFKDNLPIGSMIYYKAAGEDYKTTWVDGKCTKVERN